MWFSFPEGCTSLSVELQEFFPEIRDDEGRAYFRAPDHFAPRILMLNGFAVVEVPPIGAPDDLPKADPLRDSAIAELTRALEAQKLEVQGLRADLGASTARVVALSNERTDLEAKLKASDALVESLREQLEDK
jgi:septal ring factor EnvC (AmiA/AmiB activator)